MTVVSGHVYLFLWKSLGVSIMVYWVLFASYLLCLLPI